MKIADGTPTDKIGFLLEDLGLTAEIAAVVVDRLQVAVEKRRDTEYPLWRLRAVMKANYDE